MVLALFLFSIYLFAYRGGFHSVDEVSMFAVTESLVKFGQLNTDQIAWTQWTTSQAEAQGFFGSDGHVFSKKGLALSLAQAPLYGLALILPGLGMLQTVSLLNAIITAATAMFIMLFLWRIGFSGITLLLTSLIFGLATIAFIYAKYLFSEPLAAFLLLLAAYMLFTYRQEGGSRPILLAGLAAGFAVVTRANNLFLLPIFGVYLLIVVNERANGSEKTNVIPRSPRFAAIRHSAIRTLFVFALALAIPGLVLLTYNALRAGNPFQTGYDLSLFSSNLLLGLYKLLFSPLRGFFIYSPILLLSLPGWWLLRKTHPAESWLFAGLVGITVLLFSFWSSGEGLSWGSRFLVPVVPFFALCLAPIIERVSGSRVVQDASNPSPPAPLIRRSQTQPKSRYSQYVLRLTFFLLLLLSFFIQLVGVAMNPWVYLAQLQANFGGKFFLENTAALYDVRYSQILGQIQNWDVENSDLAWWQPWGFDPIAFGVSLALVVLTGWLLWRSSRPTDSKRSFVNLSLIVALAVSYALLARYYHTDRQFGPPNDPYTQALDSIAANASPGQAITTVAQYHYHVPMNRFKARIPLIGFAQQPWPLPETARPLLDRATDSKDVWLVTLGFPPAAADNAAEQWLALNTFKVSDTWLPEEVRRVRFTSTQPTTTRAIHAEFGNEIELTDIALLPTVGAGQPLPVAFTWQPLSPPQADYHLFLQLLNLDGALVAQHDGPPNGGYTPTSGWTPGQQITSRRALILPEKISPGDYQLIAGLYNPASGERLLTETGQDFVDLGDVVVISSSLQFPVGRSSRRNFSR